jgi:predicted metal-dependent enzyme (double-stranded beta helix superfamily)
VDPTEYTITEFVKDLRTIVTNTENETEILSQVQPLACRAAGERSWLREEMYIADLDLGFRTTLLHAEPDNSLFVVVDSWLPTRGVRPHDHGTWAVVVGITGRERIVTGLIAC